MSGTSSWRMSRRELFARMPIALSCVCCSSAMAQQFLPDSWVPSAQSVGEPSRDEGELAREIARQKIRRWDVDYDDDSYLPNNRLALLRRVSDWLSVHEAISKRFIVDGQPPKNIRSLLTKTFRRRTGSRRFCLLFLSNERMTRSKRSSLVATESTWGIG